MACDEIIHNIRHRGYTKWKTCGRPLVKYLFEGILAVKLAGQREIPLERSFTLIVVLALLLNAGTTD